VSTSSSVKTRGKLLKNFRKNERNEKNPKLVLGKKKKKQKSGRTHRGKKKDKLRRIAGASVNKTGLKGGGRGRC